MTFSARTNFLGAALLVLTFHAETSSAQEEAISFTITNRTDRALDVLRGTAPGNGVSAGNFGTFPNRRGRIAAGETIQTTSPSGVVWSFLFQGVLVESRQTTTRPNQTMEILQAAVDAAVPPSIPIPPPPGTRPPSRVPAASVPAPPRPGSMTPAGPPTSSTLSNGSLSPEGNTGSALSMNSATQLVRFHNGARKEGRIDVARVAWSEKIARYAQQRADSIARARQYPPRHLAPGQNPYGENLAAGVSSGPAWEVLALAQGWKDEQNAFQQLGSPRVFDQRVSANLGAVGHYTQMIWKDTREIGAGIASWQSGGKTYTVLVCCYSPPGNRVGGTIW